MSNLYKNKYKLAFMGSSEMSVHALNQFKELGVPFCSIITVPDKPKGRKLVLTANPVKSWAIENNVPYIEVAKFDDETFNKIQNESADMRPDLFIVASFGKIIPERVLNLAPRGALNIHPSRLPKMRGASPIQETILEDAPQTAVSIILLDKEMDHGPLLAQEEIDLTNFGDWPMGYVQTEKILAEFGAKVLADALPEYLENPEQVSLIEQNHSQATFTKKFTKEDGRVDPWSEDAVVQRNNYLKFKAFEVWPKTYFFIDKHGAKIRVKINEAKWNAELNKMEILNVTPEGGKPMAWESFLQSTSSI